MKNILLRTLISILPLIGIWMVLPSLSQAGLSLQWANPHNLALSLGIYGLGYAMFQPIWALLKPCVGEAKTVSLSMILFILGSLIAAFAYSAEALLVGRFLQGGGLIYAMYASPFSLCLALILGILLTHFLPLHTVFYSAAILGLISFILSIFLKQEPQKKSPHSLYQTLLRVAKSPFARLMILGTFLLQLLLIALFSALPTLMHTILKTAPSQHHLFYLSTSMLATLGMLILISLANWLNQSARVMTLSILALAISSIFLAQSSINSQTLYGCTLLFFTAFMTLEGLLFHRLSRVTEGHDKNTTFTLFSMAQGLGALCGSFLGMATLGSSANLFIWCVSIAALWFLYAMRFQRS